MISEHQIHEKQLEDLNWRTQTRSLKNAHHGEVVGNPDSKLPKLEQACPKLLLQAPPQMLSLLGRNCGLRGWSEPMFQQQS
jgi:hypothetical protein